MILEEVVDLYNADATKFEQSKGIKHLKYFIDQVKN